MRKRLQRHAVLPVYCQLQWFRELLVGPERVRGVGMYAELYAVSGLRQLRKPEPDVQQQWYGVGKLGQLYRAGSMFAGSKQFAGLRKLRFSEQKLQQFVPVEQLGFVYWAGSMQPGFHAERQLLSGLRKPIPNVHQLL